MFSLKNKGSNRQFKKRTGKTIACLKKWSMSVMCSYTFVKKYRNWETFLRKAEILSSLEIVEITQNSNIYRKINPILSYFMNLFTHLWKQQETPLSSLLSIHVFDGLLLNKNYHMHEPLFIFILSCHLSYLKLIQHINLS